MTHDNCDGDDWKKFTSKHVVANISGNVRDSVKQDVRSILTKFNKDKRKNINAKLPVLKRPILKWSYVGYGVKENQIISIQCWDNKTFRMSLNADISTEQYHIIKTEKLGSLRITKRNDKWIAQIAVTIQDKSNIVSNIIMGIDVGLKVPAVCMVNNGAVKFCGNGRMNKFYRRKAISQKKKMGRAKKMKALKHIKNKESRWMTYQDHCISKSVVDFAVKNNVSIIRLEKLSGIRKSTSKSRKNVGYIHRWSFYRLQQFIEYKAKRCGLQVEYVDPKFTSQICPCCGVKNKADDRTYACKECGYKTHRDLVGATNIMRISAADGKSQSA